MCYISSIWNFDTRGLEVLLLLLVISVVFKLLISLFLKEISAVSNMDLSLCLSFYLYFSLSQVFLLFLVIYLIIAISSFYLWIKSFSFFFDLVSSSSEYFLVISSPSMAFLAIAFSLISYFLLRSSAASILLLSYLNDFYIDAIYSSFS